MKFSRPSLARFPRRTMESNNVSRAGLRAAAGWLACLSWLLVASPYAQPLGANPDATAAAAEAGARAGTAECTLHLLGGEDQIIHAGLRCTGPQPRIQLLSPYMTNHTSNFTGVSFDTSCNHKFSNISLCLVTICAGRLVLKSSSVSGVQRAMGTKGLGAVVCVAGESRVEVHNSMFNGNKYTALGVFGQADVLLVGSTVANNSAELLGGGIWLVGAAQVSISGNSRVNLNRAGVEGGGVFVGGHATLRVDNSSVTGNSALNGGGVTAMGFATVTFSGGSSLQGNTADGDPADHHGHGGGLYVQYGNVSVMLTGSTHVRDNTASNWGGGLYVSNSSVVITDGSSVYNNTAMVAGGMHALSCTVTLAGGSSVHSNTAKVSAGGLRAGIEAIVTLTGKSSVHSNRAEEGTGGGLLVGVHARVTISDHSIVANNTSALVGGGIGIQVINTAFDSRGRAVDTFVYDPSDYVNYTGARVTISNSTVANNTSKGSAGGGLAVGGDGYVELVNGTVFSHNAAINGSGGAVLLIGKGRVRADDSVLFINNFVSKGYVGGTIAAFENASLTLPHAGRLTKCSVGVYLGQTTCEAGEISQHDMCVCCPQHTFSFTNVSCEPCPRNGNCSGGSLVEPLPGYWSSAPTSVQMHSCPLSTTACNYTHPTHMCNEGYTGPLCGACQLPQYGMLGPFKCGKCMQLPKLQLGLYLLLSFVSVSFVAFTVHTTWKDNLTGDKVVLATDLIKVLVQFLQYTVIIGTVSVPWPLLNVQAWFQAVNIVFAVGSGQALSLDCWLYHYTPRVNLPLAMQRQLVYFLAPVCALLAVVALQSLVWTLKRWVVPLVWRPKGGASNQPALSVIGKLPITLLVLTYYAFPTLSRASLSFFACLRIDRVPPEVQLPPGASAPLNHISGYWVSNITQPCFSGYHKGWALGLGLPSILLWCVAVPIAMGLMLFLCRAKHDEESFRQHFGFLYRSYKPERLWWEAVWVARTVVLTCVSVFAYPMQRYFAVLSLLMVFLVSAALQLILQPYAFAMLHRMHMVSTCCLVATTMGALAMFAYDTQSQSTALRLRIAIAVLVMAVNIVFVGCCIWKLVPMVSKWCVIAYSTVKSWVEAAVRCVRHPRAGQLKGRGRRGGAGGCV